MVQPGEAGIALVLVAGTCVMLVMAIFIILFFVAYQKKLHKQQEAHKRDMFEAAIQGQENERKRIARDLHDDIGGLLSAVKLKVGQAGMKIQKSQPLPAGFVQDTKTLIDEAIGNTRRISRDLLPNTLEEFGLGAALDELCTMLDTASAVNIGYRQNTGGRRFGIKAELSLYRVGQELLNNAVKHSGASKIKMLLTLQDHRLLMSVSDDGKGFNTDEVKKRPPVQKGLGLKNIESRLEMINAGIRYNAVIGKGTTAEVEMEIEQNLVA